MKLVLQTTYNEACQQACCAMLAGVSLEEIISLVGPGRMGNVEHEQVVARYGKGRANHGRFIEHFTRENNALLGVLARDGDTHWLSVADCLDVQYAHAVLLHQGQLYDPWCGINPMWPWSRYIQRSWDIIDNVSCEHRRSIRANDCDPTVCIHCDMKM